MVFKLKLVIVTLVLCAALNPYPAVKAEEAKIRFTPPPPDRGMPSGRRSGGASRSGCPATEKQLTALVPTTVVKEKGKDPTLSTWESAGGLTSASSPTLWFFVPNELTKFSQDLVLQDERGNIIYKTSLKPSSTDSNIIQRISPTVTLKPDKVYQWFFIVNCVTDTAPYVQGWIQKITLNPSLKHQLQKAALPEQINLYAANGIWYDALNTLGEKLVTNPQDVNLLSNWVSLLDSVGLSAIAYEPISKCCKTEPTKANSPTIRN